MHGRTLLAALAASLLLAAPAHADVADQCAPLGTQVQTTACHGADVISRDAAALAARERAGVREHASTWLHRALRFQHALAHDVPLRNAPWVGTHNSFNSIAEMGPAVSVMDSNQQLSLVEQLEVDVRSLELDLHWFPSARAGGMAPVVCHAQGGAGCSVEKPLGETLKPIGDWLRAHRDQVLLLYLENQLGGEQGSTAAAGAIEAQIGDLVYRPQGPSGTCVDLPKEVTRKDVLAAGKQILIVSNCGAGAAWRSWSFGWRDHIEERPRDFSCSGVDRTAWQGTIVRYFEDDTWLTSAASNAGAASRDDGLDPATTAAMTRCGVDLTGFDQLTSTDGRLAASVWSWAEGEDVTASCAALRPSDGRWTGEPCTQRRRFVCRTATGAFTSSKPVRGDQPPPNCGAPRTGYENGLARKVAGGHTAWVALPRR